MHRVVVIDDYEPSLHMYSMVVERMLGGEIVAFSDPREALHYMSAVTPTLLVLGLGTPPAESVQLVTQLRSRVNTRSVPVIMFNGSGDEQLRTRAIGAGVNAFLTKLIGAEEFAQYVKRLSAANRVRIAPRDEATLELQVRADEADKRLDERDREAIAALFRAYEARDPEAARKMRLAAQIAVLLAIECRASTSNVQMLRDAGYVYDIGKFSIPEKIFATVVQLSTQSRALVEKHAAAGAAILDVPNSKLFAAAAQLALQHHERYDGRGYPNRLSGENIAMTARVMAVADAFVAMIHKRADRPAFAFGHALDQIRRESGAHFDPNVVAAFERIKNRISIMLLNPGGPSTGSG